MEVSFWKKFGEMMKKLAKAVGKAVLLVLPTLISKLVDTVASTCKNWMNDATK